jgi:hypothetical protein
MKESKTCEPMFAHRSCVITHRSRLVEHEVLKKGVHNITVVNVHVLRSTNSGKANSWDEWRIPNFHHLNLKLIIGYGCLYVEKGQGERKGFWVEISECKVTSLKDHSTTIRTNNFLPSKTRRKTDTFVNNRTHQPMQLHMRSLLISKFYTLHGFRPGRTYAPNSFPLMILVVWYW